MRGKFPSMDNRMALVVTLAVATVLFGLFMALPIRQKGGSDVQKSGLREFPATLSSEDLFHKACTQCHSLPTLNQKSPEQWRLLVLKMNRYMAQMGYRSLSSAQVGHIVDYVLGHQKPS